MSKVVLIETCNFRCPYRVDREREPFCLNAQRVLTVFAEINHTYMLFPLWCPLPDASESTDKGYTLKDLEHTAWLLKDSDNLKQYHGPSKQRRHDCLMAIDIFLRCIKGGE